MSRPSSDARSAESVAADDEALARAAPASEAAAAPVSEMRDRVRQRWPGVLLTLTSIIQALALETLWSEVSEEAFGSLSALAIWVIGLQTLAMLLAIIVLWLFYAQLVMRFDWVPGLRDSIGPFLLGVLEFALAETIGAGRVGFWIAAFAIPVIVAQLITLSTFARAAREPENAEFFARVAFTGWMRHLPQSCTAALLVLLGCLVVLSDDAPAVTLAALIGLCLLMLLQLYLQRLYWTLTINR